MRLSKWLAKEKLTDAEFGKRIGRSQSSVTRYCSGLRIPRPKTMLRIEAETKGEVRFADFCSSEDCETSSEISSASDQPGALDQSAMADQPAMVAVQR